MKERKNTFKHHSSRASLVNLSSPSWLTITIFKVRSAAPCLQTARKIHFSYRFSTQIIIRSNILHISELNLHLNTVVLSVKVFAYHVNCLTCFTRLAALPEKTLKNLIIPDRHSRDETEEGKNKNKNILHGLGDEDLFHYLNSFLNVLFFSQNLVWRRSRRHADLTAQVVSS